jgi:hypothetical protein
VEPGDGRAEVFHVEPHDAEPIAFERHREGELRRRGESAPEEIIILEHVAGRFRRVGGIATHAHDVKGDGPSSVLARSGDVRPMVHCVDMVRSQMHALREHMRASVWPSSLSTRAVTTSRSVVMVQSPTFG